MNKNNTPQEIWQVLTSAKNPICVLSHCDFDSVLSALILKILLKGQNDLRIIAEDESYAEISEFGDTSLVEFGLNLSDVDFTAHDLAVFVDTSDLDRFLISLGEEAFNDMKKVNIDHHATNTYFADFNYVVKRGAAASVIYEIVQKVGLDMTLELAELFIAALVRDTIFFSLNSVTSDDFRMAAELQDFGVDIFNIMYKLTFNESEDSIKFKAFIYSRTTFKDDHVSVVYEWDELKEAGIDITKTTQRDADLIKKVKGIDYGIVIRGSEKGKGIYTISLRSSHEEINVAKIATKLGGGGHKMAAGATLEGFESATKALDFVLKTIKSIK